MMSTVNMAEVVARLVDREWSEGDINDAMQAITYRSMDFTADLAAAAGFLRRATRSAGLSAGDRACLALALSHSVPVLTADRAWAQLHLGIEIRLIR